MAMKPWGFYGRKEELRELHEFMDSDIAFNAMAIRGRRQVGKTGLVRHFFRNWHQEETDGARPIVMFHLSEAEGSAPWFYRQLKNHLNRNLPELLDGFRPSGDDVDDFPELVSHLLGQGCTVVLDEFQRISEDGRGGLYMASLFQKVLDDMWMAEHRPGFRPRLVVLGSAQQRLMELFQHPRAPMFGRIAEYLHVRPWTFGELREAAASQGWDRDPRRLLTLWTAYGGMPAHWQRFSRSRHLSDFEKSVSGREWTDVFLEREEKHRQTPGGSFVGQLEVELRPEDVEFMAWLAKRPGGRRLGDIPENLEMALAGIFQEEFPNRKRPAENRVAATEILRDAVIPRLSGMHLGLLARRDAVDDPRAERWHVADNHARFQLDVLEHVANESAATETTGRDIVRAMRRERLRYAEGRGLETLAAAGLEHLLTEGFGPHGREGKAARRAGEPFAPAGRIHQTDLVHGAWRKHPQAEIDVLVLDRKERILWLCSAKRHARKHEPVKDCRNLERYLSPVAESDNGKRRLEGLSDFRRNLLFTAPEFRGGAVEKLGKTVAKAKEAGAVADGWFIMDIGDMLSGRGPRLLPLPQQKPPPDGSFEP